ncbi:MAG: hypothetical protein WBN20_12840 [Eudoraea sp.]|uniref:hypothetical protein n=1 Tax=Eudoraea sp. TaxID=1979955 RepID=UPI003C74278F
MMRNLKLTIIAVISSWTSYSQIEAGLLLGLTNATATEISAISGANTGSLIYNATDQSVYQFNGLSWIAVGSSTGGWNTTGNSGTTSSTNFIGTSDAQDLILKSNNTEKLRLVQDRGQVLINQASVFNSHPLVIKANGIDILAFQDNTGTPKWHWNLLSGGLNFVESNVADYRLFLKNGGNVGVNTNDPTQQLDVNGNVRIRTLSNAAESDDILAVDATGVLQRSKVNYGGRWTNTDTSTNLNNNNTTIPLFGSEDYKDDGNNLYTATSTSLTIKETGRYDIRANLSFVGISSGGNTHQRTNVNARIAVNGTAIGAIGASGYIRWASGHNHSSVHVSEILQLNANDVVTIITYREANSGTVRFSGSGESSFVINKLR